MIALPRPTASEHAEYYGRYIAQVPDGDVLATLLTHGAAALAMFESLDDARAAHRYAAGKWSIRQVLGHIVDGERLFAHRALAIARCDPADQPSMDQDIWMAGADFDRRTMASLCAEFRAVRAASLALFGSFDREVGERRGRASGNPFSVRSLVWTVAGHAIHHVTIVRERYGLG